MRGPRLTYDRSVMIGWANVYDDEDALIFVVPIADLPQVVDVGSRVSVSTHGVAETAIKRAFTLAYTPEGTFIDLPELGPVSIP